MADKELITSFANHILSDWDSAMHEFFSRIERKMRTRNLTPTDVQSALYRGYGDEIGDAWAEWIGDES